MKRILFVCCLALLAGLTVQAQDQKVMHCFTFTQIEGATAADWAAFNKATGELPGKIPGLTAVWQGKLARPQTLFMPDMPPRPPAAPPAEGAKAPEPPKPPAGDMKVKRIQRQYGVCMEFASQDALKAYAKHDAHAAWMATYEKVRVPGTTTFDMLLVK